MSETNFENLIVEQADGVMTITFNRPKVLNALNRPTLDELSKAIDLAEDPAVRAVIITGSGEKAFVAGADINELREAGPLDAKRTAGRGQELFSRLERLGKPVVAAINGFALGGGLELACACTFRTASTNAQLGLPEVKLGIIPGYGGTQRLGRLVGLGRAAELICTGDFIKADEAYRLGLVNHVYEPDQLLPETRKIVGRILKRAPIAVQYALEALFRSPDLAIDEGLNLEGTLFGILAGTEDTKEGMSAFLEKREANFQGR